MSTYIKSFSDIPLVVNRLKSILESEGIPSIIKNQIDSSVLAGFGSIHNSVDLYLLNTDLDKANTIIEEFRKEIAE